MNQDDTQLYALLKPIFTEPWKPLRPVEFWYFMARAIGPVATTINEPESINTTWIDISRTDRKSACLSINQRIARNLTTIT